MGGFLVTSFPGFHPREATQTKSSVIEVDPLAHWSMEGSQDSSRRIYTTQIVIIALNFLTTQCLHDFYYRKKKRQHLNVINHQVYLITYSSQCARPDISD